MGPSVAFRADSDVKWVLWRVRGCRQTLLGGATENTKTQSPARPPATGLDSALESQALGRGGGCQNRVGQTQLTRAAGVLLYDCPLRLLGGVQGANPVTRRALESAESEYREVGGSGVKFDQSEATAHFP